MNEAEKLEERRTIARDIVANALAVPTGQASQEVAQLEPEEVEQICNAPLPRPERRDTVKTVLASAYDRRQAASASSAKTDVTEFPQRRRAADLIERHGNVSRADALNLADSLTTEQLAAVPQPFDDEAAWVTAIVGETPEPTPEPTPTAEALEDAEAPAKKKGGKKKNTSEPIAGDQPTA